MMKVFPVSPGGIRFATNDLPVGALHRECFNFPERTRQTEIFRKEMPLPELHRRPRGIVNGGANRPRPDFIKRRLEGYSRGRNKHRNCVRSQFSI